MAEDAEDALSVTFLELWRQHHKILLVDDSLRPWVLGVAINVLRQFHRSRGRHKAVLARYAGVDQEAEEPDHADEVARVIDGSARARLVWLAMAELPVRQRQIADLCLVAGLTVREAAAVLGIPVTTAQSRLEVARAVIRSLVQKAEHLAGSASCGNDMSGRTSVQVARGRQA